MRTDFLKTFFLNLTLLLLPTSTLPRNTWAVCETQQENLQTWTKNCAIATTSAELTCIAASAAAIPTFGASLAACVAAVAVRDNQCKIKNNKQSDLKNCLEEEIQKKLAADKEIERLLLENQLKMQRSKKFAEIFNTYENQKRKLKMDFEEQLFLALNSLYEEGFDPNTDEFKNAKREVILKKASSSTEALEKIEKERDELLKPIQK
jgi:hypothetical protein